MQGRASIKRGRDRTCAYKQVHGRTGKGRNRVNAEQAADAGRQSRDIPLFELGLYAQFWDQDWGGYGARMADRHGGEEAGPSKFRAMPK